MNQIYDAIMTIPSLFILQLKKIDTSTTTVFPFL